LPLPLIPPSPFSLLSFIFTVRSRISGHRGVSECPRLTQKEKKRHSLRGFGGGSSPHRLVRQPKQQTENTHALGRLNLPLPYQAQPVCQRGRFSAIPLASRTLQPCGWVAPSFLSDTFVNCGPSPRVRVPFVLWGTWTPTKHSTRWRWINPFRPP